MEELLNKLIEKGWKPFGIEGIKEFHLRTYECERGTNKIMIKHFEGYFTDGIKTSDYPRDYGSRMYVVYGLKHIVAKESGLWLFCVENKLVKTKDKKVRYRYEDLERTQNYFSWHGYEYRIIESALCNEEALEKFLLDNIKVEGNEK